MRKLLRVPAVLSVLALGGGVAQAAELLTNGNLDLISPPPGWTLSETVTGMPEAIVNSAQLEGFANQPMEEADETGIWLRSFAGNQGGLTNQNINAVLSQTVPGVAGENYTFSGWSRWEPNYSGAVEFLDSLSPSGEVPSPTESMFELAFLDASNAVLGSPVALDLRTEQFGDSTWRQHTLVGMAPAGTASVRVTALAIDMVANIDPMQSGLYDNFSLTNASAPATEILINSELNEAPPEAPGFTLVKNPAEADTIGIATFANNTAGGVQGVWLKAFANGDGLATQTVPGVVGGDYTFSAWSKWEENYSGGVTDTTTDTFLELAFLDESEEVIGDPLTLDLLAEGQMNDGMWRQYSLNGVAPEGTANVRVTAGATGMFATMDPGQSAFFDDFSLMLASAAVAGDYNENGVVDAADYTVWRDNLGSTTSLPNDDTAGVGQDDYTRWKTNFGDGGTGTGSGAGLGAAVPEPACCMLALFAAVGGSGMRRRRSAP